MNYLMIGAAALAFATPALAQGDALVTADTVLATVNGTDITLGHLIAMRERLPAEYRNIPDAQLYDGMLQQIIQQQILADATTRDRATEFGLANETRAFVAGRAVTELSERPVDEAVVQAAYDARFAEAPTGPEYNASHILVETEEAAQALIAELEAGADFVELARENSTGPSGPNGGQLGWFGAGMMVPPFEAAVAGMEPGTVSAPVQTDFGWHVIRLNETREQMAPPLDEVRAQIEGEVRNAAVQAELERLTGEAEVTRAEVEVDPALIRDLGLLED